MSNKQENQNQQNQQQQNQQEQQEQKKSKFELAAEEIGTLVTAKNKAYGNSFEQAGSFLQILYPNGIPVEAYTDALCLVRMFDKMMRIATHKNAFGESSYKDLAGYSVLGYVKDTEKLQGIGTEVKEEQQQAPLLKQSSVKLTPEEIVSVSKEFFTEGQVKKFAHSLLDEEQKQTSPRLLPIEVRYPDVAKDLKFFTGADLSESEKKIVEDVVKDVSVNKERFFAKEAEDLARRELQEFIDDKLKPISRENRILESLREKDAFTKKLVDTAKNISLEDLSQDDVTMKYVQYLDEIDKFGTASGLLNQVANVRENKKDSSTTSHSEDVASIVRYIAANTKIPEPEKKSDKVTGEVYWSLPVITNVGIDQFTRPEYVASVFGLIVPVTAVSKHKAIIVLADGSERQIDRVVREVPVDSKYLQQVLNLKFVQIDPLNGNVNEHWLNENTLPFFKSIKKVSELRFNSKEEVSNWLEITNKNVTPNDIIDKIETLISSRGPKVVEQKQQQNLDDDEDEEQAVCMDHD